MISLPRDSGPDEAPGRSASPGRRASAGGNAPATDEYIQRLFAPEDAFLAEVGRVISDEGLPEIQVPPITGRTLQLLLRMIGARRVLEVGTLAGYSALWIARSLPSEPEEGEGLLTLEIEPEHARLARELLHAAGVGDRVEVRQGDARALLPTIEPDGSFDAVFLDADKEGLPDYLDQARRLLRPGGLLIVDNALWKGRVVEPAVRDSATEAIRHSHELVAADPKFDAMILPVGDGLLVALRR